MPDVDIDFFDRDGVLKLFNTLQRPLLRTTKLKNTKLEYTFMLYHLIQLMDMQH